MAKIGDLIEVPEIEPVVRLEDAGDRVMARNLVQSFVVTQDIRRLLDLIMPSLESGQGKGFFIMGSYGSGKSHLLSVLSLVCAARDGKDVPAELASLARNLLVGRVSLLRFRAQVALEDAVMSSLPDAIKPPPSSGKQGEIAGGDRSRALQAIMEGVQRAGHSGFLLCIDELSEFLRSKPSRPSLNEDARFLQFLGEASRDLPLWIVASTQEAIERTGDIAQPVLAKIKDRYPTRLTLSEVHIKELVGRRLVVRKKGAEALFRQVHEDIQSHFPRMCFSREEFKAIYPLHPATISFLEGLAPLFSRHRGLVEFVYSSLVGPPPEAGPPRLARDAAELIGPEEIFDHFRPRIREMEKTSAYDEVAFKHFRRYLPEVFPDKKNQELARRLLKILILIEISPVEQRRTVRQLTELLLCRISDLNPELNYQYVSEALLEPMSRKLNYLLRESPGRNRLDDVFFIDLAEEMVAPLNREVDRLLAEYTADDTRLLRQVLGDLEIPGFPFANLIAGAGPERALNWLGSRRLGGVEFKCFDEIEEERLVLREREDAEGETDFTVFIGLPCRRAEQERALPGLLRVAQRSTTIFYLPAALSKKEMETLRRYFACGEIRAGRESSARAERLRKSASAERDKLEATAREAVLSSYGRGKFINREMEMRAGFGPTSAISLEQVLEGPVRQALARVYPEYLKVRPEVEYVSQADLRKLETNFIPRARIPVREAEATGTRRSLEAILIPLGLVALKRSTYTLNIDPLTNPLIRMVLEEVGDAGVLTAQLIRLLRKGPYGLPDELARFLLVCLVHSGHLEAERQGKLIPARFFDLESVRQTDNLRPGKIIDPSLQRELLQFDFLRLEGREEFFSLKEQQDYWQKLGAAKRVLTEQIAFIRESLHALLGYPVSRHLDLGSIEEALSRASPIFSSVHTSFPSQEGLEAFLREKKEPEEISRRIEEINNMFAFFRDQKDAYLRAAQYLEEADEVLKGYRPNEEVELSSRQAKRALERTAEFIRAGRISDFLETFADFKKAFVAEYLQKHRQVEDKGQAHELEKVRQSRSYRALRNLQDIEAISVPTNMSVLEQKLEAEARQYCRRVVPSELEIRPICSCGYRPGQKVSFLKAKDLSRMIEKGIEEYGLELSEPDIKEKLTNQVRTLGQVGESKRSVSLRAFLEVLKHAERRVKFLTLVEKDLIEEINKALGTGISIHKRSLDELSRRLGGRKLPLIKLRQILEQWLRGEEKIGENDYIHILGREKGVSRDEAKARALAWWLEQHKVSQEEASPDLEIRMPPERPDERTSGRLAEDNDLVERLRGLAHLRELPFDKLARFVECESIFLPLAREAYSNLLNLALREGKLLQFCRLGAPHFPRLSETHSLLIPVLKGIVAGERVGAGRSSVLSERDYWLLPLTLSTLALKESQAEVLTWGAFSLLQDAVRKALRLGERPLPGDNIPGLRALFEESPKTFLVILFDGMRLDFWEILKGELTETLQIEKESFYYSQTAANSQTQRQHLFGEDVPLDRQDRFLASLGWNFFSSAELDTSFSQVSAALEEMGRPTFLTFNFIDARAHHASVPLGRLFEEVREEFQESVLPLLKKVPRGTPCLIISDHGFQEAPNWRGQGDRYRHTGGSIWERVVIRVTGKMRA